MEKEMDSIIQFFIPNYSFRRHQKRRPSGWRGGVVIVCFFPKVFSEKKLFHGKQLFHINLVVLLDGCVCKSSQIYLFAIWHLNYTCAVFLAFQSHDSDFIPRKWRDTLRGWKDEFRLPRLALSLFV
jgi:hypothetical protein